MKVALLGDSLMVGAAPWIRKQQPDWLYREFSKVGIGLKEGLDHAAILLDGWHPDVVMVSLGTNDYFGRPPTFLANGIDRLRRIVGQKPVVVWATIRRPVKDHPAAYRDWNLYLLRRAEKHPLTFRAVDWEGLVAQYPLLVGPDGIHPGPLGYQRRAELYVLAVVD